MARLFRQAFKSYPRALQLILSALILAGSCPSAVSAQTTTTAATHPAADELDKIYCTDGTIVEGKILREAPEFVEIDTRRGKFSYQRVDIRRVEKARPKATPTPLPAQTPYFDINQILPSGPLNPAAPPKVPNLFRIAANSMRLPTPAGAPVKPTVPVAAPTATAAPAPSKPDF